MIRPNVRCSYLLQVRPLEDTHREHSGPQETTFPDYERFSMPRETLPPWFHLSVNPWFLAFFRDCLSPLISGGGASSFGTIEKPFQTLQSAKHPNKEGISKDPDGKE
jgi:hypothetical protein